MIHSIGNFKFLELRGVPDKVKQRLDVIARPNVDGVAIWELGLRGQPFELQSSVDAADQASALDLFDRYTELSKQDPVAIVWRDILLSGAGLMFQVLDVRPIAITSLAVATGGLNPPSLGWIECGWLLLPVAVTN